MKYFPDVVILYEHKARELYSCYLLKYELKKRGITAWVCHNSYRHTWWIRLVAKPKIVVSLCALTTELIPGWSIMDQYSSFLRCRPRYYINLQVEQMFRDHHAQYNIVTEKEYRDFIYYVCWGERRKQQILREGVKESHIWVTGALQLDFCRKKFAFLFLTREEIARKYQIDRDKKWILFISSFPYVTYSEKELKWGEKIQNSYQNKKKGSNAYELKRIATDTYQTLLDWIDRLLNDDSYIFIYRPHPGERKTKRIEQLMKKYPNRFFYLSEGGIHQWIRVCDVIDTWVSTAYAEAIFLEKPCNLIQPYGAPAEFEPVFCSSCKKICSYSEFVDVHRGGTREDLETEKKRLMQYYDWGKVPAYLTICERIEHLFYDSQSCFRSDKKKMLKYLFSKAYFMEIYVSFVFTFKIRMNFNFFHQTNKLKWFNQKLIPGGEIYTDCYITREEKKVLRKLRKAIVKN